MTITVLLQCVDEASMIKSLKEKGAALEVLKQAMREHLKGLTPAPKDIIDDTIDKPVISDWYEYSEGSKEYGINS